MTVLDQVKSLCDEALRTNDGGTALRALRAIRAARLTLIAPVSTPAPEFPGLKTLAGGAWIDVKYPGRCRDCGATYDEGTRVYWVRGEGCYCADCAPEEDR